MSGSSAELPSVWSSTAFRQPRGSVNAASLFLAVYDVVQCNEAVTVCCVCAHLFQPCVYEVCCCYRLTVAHWIPSLLSGKSVCKLVICYLVGIAECWLRLVVLVHTEQSHSCCAWFSTMNAFSSDAATVQNCRRSAEKSVATLSVSPSANTACTSNGHGSAMPELQLLLFIIFHSFSPFLSSHEFRYGSDTFRKAEAPQPQSCFL